MKEYNKVVREFIPDIIMSNGGLPDVKEIHEYSHIKSVMNEKLIEEAKELSESKSRDDILDELADVYECLQSIMILNCLKREELEAVLKAKQIKRGKYLCYDDSKNISVQFLKGVKNDANS